MRCICLGKIGQLRIELELASVDSNEIFLRIYGMPLTQDCLWCHKNHFVWRNSDNFAYAMVSTLSYDVETNWCLLAVLFYHVFDGPGPSSSNPMTRQNNTQCTTSLQLDSVGTHQWYA